MELKLNGLTNREKKILLELLYKIEQDQETKDYWDIYDKGGIQPNEVFDGGNSIETFLILAHRQIKHDMKVNPLYSILLMFYSILDDLYVPVSWPDNQELMDKDWWRYEAILDVDSKIGDSTYLVPIKHLKD